MDMFRVQTEASHEPQAKINHRICYREQLILEFYLFLPLQNSQNIGINKFQRVFLLASGIESHFMQENVDCDFFSKTYSLYRGIFLNNL
jgi:hypothetical protein